MLENNKVKLYSGDALKFLDTIPDGIVDMVLTDPPYNSDAIEWDKKDNEWQVQWLQKVKRVMKDGASFYCFFAPLNMYVVEGWIRENLNLRNLLVWWHPNLWGAGMSYGKDRYKSSWDIVFYAIKEKKIVEGMPLSSLAWKEYGSGMDVIKVADPRGKVHKAQKPLELLKRFIIVSSNENDIVLDPFMGSGSTGAAALSFGRKFWGSEINPEFFNTAKSRIEKIEKSYNKFEFGERGV